MLAEFAGNATPDGLRRLLNCSQWDEDGCRDALSRYVVRHLGDPAAVLAVDETGFLKKGKMSAGVARQYTGTAGWVENCQAGVFLAYAAPDGSRALTDRDRCRAALIGDDVGFATKPGLAEKMIGRAVSAGVPFSWVTGDEVYGGNPGLREYLEKANLAYVMAVACNDMITVPAGSVRADELAAMVPAEGWQRWSEHQPRSGPAATRPATAPQNHHAPDSVSTHPYKLAMTQAHRSPISSSERGGSAARQVLPEGSLSS
jgi:SRSO17 transposase